MNISELVQRAKQNDDDAIKELYDLTARKGYFIALKYMNNEESANDVLQNAYVKVFQKLDTLEDTSRFESFLYTTITREAINFGKSKEEVHKTKTFSSMDSEEDGLEFVESIEDDTVEFQPDSAVDYSELKQAMNQIINELPQDQKMAILMYYFEELSVGEIAETFRVTKNTIKSRLKYGRDRIKEKVEEMQKSGRPIFGIAPIPFIKWMLTQEEAVIDLPTITLKTTGIVSGTAAKATATATKKGIKEVLKTKIIAGTVTASIVIGGGYYLMTRTDSIDVTENIQYEIEGINGYGEINVTGNTIDIDDIDSSELIKGYEIEGNKTLSNGDSVTITVNYNEDYAKEHHLKVINQKKKVDIKGLTERYKNKDEISEKTIQLIHEYALDKLFNEARYHTGNYRILKEEADYQKEFKSNEETFEVFSTYLAKFDASSPVKSDAYIVLLKEAYEVSNENRWEIRIRYRALQINNFYKGSIKTKQDIENNCSELMVFNPTNRFPEINALKDFENNYLVKSYKYENVKYYRNIGIENLLKNKYGLE